MGKTTLQRARALSREYRSERGCEDCGRFKGEPHRTRLYARPGSPLTTSWIMAHAAARISEFLPDLVCLCRPCYAVRADADRIRENEAYDRAIGRPSRIPTRIHKNLRSRA